MLTLAIASTLGALGRPTTFRPKYITTGGTIQKEAERVAATDSKTLEKLHEAERFRYYRAARANLGLLIPCEAQ